MKHMLNLFKRYLFQKKYIAYMLITVILVVAQTYIQLVVVLGAMNRIIDEGVAKSDMNAIISSGIMMLIYTLIQICCTLGVSYFNSVISGNLVRRLRLDCYRKVLSMNMEEFEHFGASSLLSRTLSDPKAIVSLMEFLLGRVVIFPAALGCILVVTFIKNRQVFWTFLIAIVISVVVLLIFKAHAQKYYKILQNRIDHFNLSIAEKITGVRTIRAFGCEKYEEKKGIDEDDKIMDAAVKANRPLYLMTSVTMLIFNWATVIIYLISSGQIQENLLSISNIIFIFQYLSYCIMILTLIPSLVNLLPKAIVASNRVMDLLNEPSEMTVAKKPFEVKDGTIEFKNVTFGYLNGRRVLEDLNFTIPGGETLAIVGPTGSGKSTILHLILGFYDLKEGDILIDGVSIRDISQEDLAKTLSYAPQGNYIFQDTIRNNIVAFHENVEQEMIEKACRMAAFEEVVKSSEDGLETEMMQNGVNLSGGQRKRLVLSRALSKDAAVYLMDEPFAALDAVTESCVRNNIDRELKGKTKIIVSSKLSSIIHADHILVLDADHVAGFGTHKELLKNCRLYKELFDIQNGGEGT